MLVTAHRHAAIGLEDRERYELSGTWTSGTVPALSAREPAASSYASTISPQREVGAVGTAMTQVDRRRATGTVIVARWYSAAGHSSGAASQPGDGTRRTGTATTSPTISPSR